MNRARVALTKKNYKLQSHQEVGLKWLLNKELNDEYKGGLLCDDPGLGKTIQTAALMLGNPVNKTLIVVPTSVFSQWKDILTILNGGEKIYLHTGPKRAQTILELYAMLDKFNIALTTYGLIIDSFSKDPTTILHAIKWDRIILDEGHYIRNPKTKIFKMACKFRTTYRWILTGTPIQNKIKDIASLFNFIGIPQTKIQDNIDNLISRYVLRRTKEILFNDEFTDYEIINHQCPFSTKKEQDLYEAIQRDAVKELLNTEDEHKLQLLIIELVLRLRQASIHPSIAIKSLKKKFPEKDWGTKFIFDDISTKIFQITEKIKESDGLSLVFCHFQEEMVMIQDYLSKSNIHSEIYNGSLSIANREKIISKFSSENTKVKYRMYNNKLHRVTSNKPTVLIIQIKAGGVGLNLQQFQNVFICSPDWNPSNEIQAIARSHRIGQNNTVKVHKFTLIKNLDFGDKKLSTIDQRILGIQFKKRLIMSELLNDNSLQFRDKLSNGRVNYSIADLMSLLCSD